MENTLTISLQKLNLGHFQTLFEDLQAAQDEFKVEFCVIGATARDLWFRAKTDHLPYRTTKDLDVTVWLDDMSQWTVVRGFLIEQRGYQKRRNPIKLFKQALELDILPIGEVEDSSREVRLLEKGGELQTLGMREVFAQAPTLSIAEGFRGRIASVPQIALLKLISYSFQSEWRSHDVGDVEEMAQYFGDLENDLIYERYGDLLDRYDVASSVYLTQVGAHALGREIRDFAQINPDLPKLVLQTASQIARNRTDNPTWQALLGGLHGK